MTKLTEGISKFTAWLDSELRADLRLHALLFAAVAAVSVHALWFIDAHWLRAIMGAGVLGVAWEVYQLATGRGQFDLADIAADLAGGAIVALAVL